MIDIEEETCQIEDNSLFNTLNLCRFIFYTPILLLGSLIGSIVYDYITYKDDTSKENNTD